MRSFEGSALLVKHASPVTHRFEQPPAFFDSVVVIRGRGPFGDELQVEMAKGT